jgi:hypothetical protein
MRLAAPLAIAAVAAALLAGCGSSDGDSDGTQAPARDGYGGPERGTPPRASGAEAPAGASARGCDTHAVDAQTLRVTGVSCGAGREVMFGWQRAEGCGLIGTASRGSCSVRSYRCLATRTDRGVSVSCAQPGRSIAFVAQRR